MKICAISPFSNASKKEMLTFISTLNHDLIVLPGNGPNHPSCNLIQQCMQTNSRVFVEVGSGKFASKPWLVSKTSLIQMPDQIFAQTPRTGDIDALELAWPKRTFSISERVVSFAICGEIDGFSKNGSVKYGRKLPFDVLINPTHTIRGRWNHLGVKLSNLSIGTAVIHTANNNKNKFNLTTHLRLYVNGVICTRQNTGKLTWSECQI